MISYNCIECCALYIFSFFDIEDIIDYCYKNMLSNKTIQESLKTIINMYKANLSVYKNILSNKIQESSLNEYPILIFKNPIYCSLEYYFIKLFRNNKLKHRSLFLVTRLEKVIFIKNINNDYGLLFITNAHYNHIYFYVLKKENDTMRSGYLYNGQHKTEHYNEIIKLI